MTWMNDGSRRISLQELVGKGYAEFWNSRRRYVVCKGSRGSKKSKTAALWHIVRMMQYPLSNTLVVRKTERTLRDSCFADLRWAIDRLQVGEYWKATVSPLELTYRPTGQKILFRGLDDPLKITSISVPHGSVNFVWVEEAYEISRESDFDILDESIRGEVPDGYFKRITLTFNPWSQRHWLKARFFDRESDDVLAMTTTYQCNEWLSESDRKLFDDMRERNPRRYQVAALGNWGITEGLVFENWEELGYPLSEVEGLQKACGLDFGWVDPLAFIVSFIDMDARKIYIWDELYQSGLSNRKAYDRITEMGYGHELIVADCAEPKSIAELKGYGLKVTAAEKGRDSIMAGIRFLQDFHVIVHPRCVNFLNEISNYGWKADRFGHPLDEPADEYNHLIDAWRYSMERYRKRKGWVI